MSEDISDFGQMPNFFAPAWMAAMLNISPQAIYKAINTGSLSAVQHGRRKLVPVECAAEWLTARRLRREAKRAAR